jgi:hypothetical protein
LLNQCQFIHCVTVLPLTFLKTVMIFVRSSSF